MLGQQSDQPTTTEHCVRKLGERLSDSDRPVQTVINFESSRMKTRYHQFWKTTKIMGGTIQSR